MKEYNFLSISFHFTENSEKEFIQNKIKIQQFEIAVQHNKNFLKELYKNLKNIDELATHQYFNQQIPFCTIEGFPSFFIGVKKQNITLFEAQQKADFLRKAQENISSLHWSDVSFTKEITTAVLDYKPKLIEAYNKIFKFDKDLLESSSFYCSIIIDSVIDIIAIPLPFFNKEDIKQVVFFTNSKYNRKVGAIKERFLKLQMLFKYIELYSTPNNLHKAIQFFDYHTKHLNNTFFKYTYLYDILETEIKTFSNEQTIENIKFNLELFKNQSEVIVNKNNQPKTSKKALKKQSFKYKELNKKLICITDLMNVLKHKNLIDNSTNLKDFRKVFSGEAIDKPIVWTGNISELSYFIKQLHNKLKLVEDLKQQQWAVTINCFIQENGEQYNRIKLRTQKVPATSKSIVSALNTLK